MQTDSEQSVHSYHSQSHSNHSDEDKQELAISQQSVTKENPSINNSIIEVPEPLHISQLTDIEMNHIGQRIEQIESHLKRVCNQHEALLPLLSISTLPHIKKDETILAKLKTNYLETEQKLIKVEDLITADTNQHVFGTIERNFKNTNNQVNNLQKEIKDINNKLIQVSKLAEVKLKEEAGNIYRNVDSKLEKNKQDIGNVLKEFQTTIYGQIKPKDQKQINFYTDQSQMSQVIEEDEEFSLLNYFKKELSNIYREFGLIRIQIELKKLRYKKQYIQQNIPVNISAKQREQQLLKLEEQSNMNELNNFIQDNQERLLQSLEKIEKKVKFCISNKQFYNDEIMYIQDQYFNISQQVKGSQKKYVMDAKKLEDRYQNMYSKNNKIDFIKEFQDRLDQINEDILQKVDQLKQKQTYIDKQIQILKKQNV